MGEGLLITSGGSEFKIGITSMKKEYLWELFLALAKSKKHLTMRVLQMRIGVRGEN